jgi:hypothetical protein
MVTMIEATLLATLVARVGGPPRTRPARVTTIRAVDLARENPDGKRRRRTGKGRS